ncbi:trypsin-like peptidase domain-containing protein [Arcanobacterium haemolyticum]|nr:trypsin-like peptidase domain-containing protein [Arcanobacterium haemolyticum]
MNNDSLRPEDVSPADSGAQPTQKLPHSFAEPPFGGANPGSQPETGAAQPTDRIPTQDTAPLPSGNQPNVYRFAGAPFPQTERFPSRMPTDRTAFAGTGAPSAPFSHPSEPPFVSQQGSPFAGNGGSFGGQPPFGTPFAGTMPSPSRPPKRRKHSWSSSLLALTAGFSLLVGGVVGFGIRDMAAPHSTAAPSSDSQQSQPVMPQFPGQDGQSSGQQSAVDSGTIVESAPGVVLVNTTLMNGAGAGTGVIIDKSGLVLTNYHVVSSSETVTLTVADSGKEYEAKVLGHDATRDIALLQIQNGSNFETVETDSGTVKAGSSVYAVGNGSGQGYLTKVEGTVTGLNQTITAQDSASASGGETLTGLIETSADVVSGYSGGPLMNSDGKVIGITTAASTGTTTDDVNGYAIPIKTALEIANKIKNGESTDTITIGRNPALGVMISNAQGGVGIVQVIEGSGAQAAGLAEGDVITAVDGTTVSDASELSDLVLTHSIGDKLTLTITDKSGTTKDVEVTLGESSVN